MFLDRDGVINPPVVRSGKPHPPADLAAFRIYPEVPEACRLLKGAGFLLVVATNQPDVGRGTQAREVVEAMHEVLCRSLPIDRVEVCYDADTDGPATCHKPSPLMLARAAGALRIDLGMSYMVGDRWRDVDCGHAAGCTTVFIDRGYQEDLRQPPDHRAQDLLHAARLILELSARGGGPPSP